MHSFVTIPKPHVVGQLKGDSYLLSHLRMQLYKCLLIIFSFFSKNNDIHVLGVNLDVNCVQDVFKILREDIYPTLFTYLSGQYTNPITN